MLNFAEQTGSGAVIVVWSFLVRRELLQYTIADNRTLRSHSQHNHDNPSLPTVPASTTFSPSIKPAGKLIGTPNMMSDSLYHSSLIRRHKTTITATSHVNETDLVAIRVFRPTTSFGSTPQAVTLVAIPTSVHYTNYC